MAVIDFNEHIRKQLEKGPPENNSCEGQRTEWTYLDHNKLCANTKRLHSKETSKDKNEEECFQHIETTISGHNYIITAVLLDRG